jgi:ubiquitin carboxyl-terminal hydrolase 4/11/15
VAEAVKVDDSSNVPYRVWKLTNIDDWRTVEFPTEKMEDLGADIVEESEISLEDHGIEDGDAYIVEFKSSDGWLVESDSSKKTFAIEGPPPLFDSKDSFFNRMGSSSSKSATTATSTTTATAKTTTDFFSGFSSKSITSNKSYNKTLVPGTLGLGNM